MEGGEEDVKGFEIKVVPRVNVVVEDECVEEEEDEEPVQEVVVDDLVEGLFERWIESFW